MAKVTFTAPSSFSMPEGVQMGETFDSVCTFRVEKDGKLCLVKLGDSDMAGYDDKESKPSYSGYAKDMQGAMQEGE